MKTVFSPRELARAIGVSESSLKRWVDQGRIEVNKTPGGHRRIALHAAIRFLKDNEIDLVEPAALGLVDLGVEDFAADETGGGQALRDLLLAGEAEAARSLVLGRFITGVPVASICDGPIRWAMASIGALWRERPDGIYLEHRATDICFDALRALRSALRVPAEAPIALGAAPERDPYGLPSLMAATVLESVGFRATNLGADTPLDSLERAVQDTSARLAWLCLSSISDGRRLGERISELALRLAGRGCALIVGGRDAEHLALLDREAPVVVGESMADLARFAADRFDRAQT